jgi:CheY-like chemotaxis protein
MSSETLLVYGGTREKRRAMQRLLAGAGFRVLLASSMAEAAKCLAGDQVRAILVADASLQGESERESGRSTWRERGIPVIDVVNDNWSLQTAALDIALLDVVRDALAGPRESSATPRP